MKPGILLWSCPQTEESEVQGGSNSVLQPGRPAHSGHEQTKQIFDMLFVAEDKNASAKLARSKSALDLLMDDTRCWEGNFRSMIRIPSSNTLIRSATPRSS